MNNNQAMSYIQRLYQDYPEMPYISPDRNVQDWVEGFETGKSKPVPQRNMVRTSENLLPGQIIYLWLINFGTHTTETWTPKYFEYTYGIDGPIARQELIDLGYIRVESAFESLDHVTGAQIKTWLKSKDVKGLSKLKKPELERALRHHYTEEELSPLFDVRGFALTEQGETALLHNQAIVDRHPKKKF